MWPFEAWEFPGSGWGQIGNGRGASANAWCPFPQYHEQSRGGARESRKFENIPGKIWKGMNTVVAPCY